MRVFNVVGAREGNRVLSSSPQTTFLVPTIRDETIIFLCIVYLIKNYYKIKSLLNVRLR